MDADFFEKIREISDNLPALLTSSQLLDDETKATLANLTDLNIQEIVDDLKKGNYLGKRKLDIDLSLNNQSEEEECTYKSVTLILNTGKKIKIDFTTTTELGDIVVEEISSYTALYTKIIAGIKSYNLSQTDEQLRIVNYELDVINQTIADLNTMLRLRDADGTACNIDIITLEYYSSGNPLSTTPSYAWSDTTSSLEVLSNIVPSLLVLGENIKDFSALADKEDEMQYLYDNRDINENINNFLPNLNILSDNIQEILNARTYAETAETISNQISDFDPSVVFLASGETAHVEYNQNTGSFILYMPEGEKGERGNAFSIGASGNTTGKSSYDGASKDFSYLDTSTGKIYFKLSDVVADWSLGFSFLGEKGDEGVGVSNVSVVTVDETNKIRFTKTDSTTHDIVITKSMLGLENVNNTSDLNKPISLLQQTSLNSKVNTSDVKNNLTSTDTNKPLSANQGKILKDLIDSIQNILLSDDTTLDSFQELVNYIEQNRTTLQALGISNISGLVNALEGKQDNLISGTNIKTVQGNSLLGSGNIEIAGVPSGAIFEWHGTIANIPATYFLCDGNNGTPDKSKLFVMGSTQEAELYFATQETFGSADAVNVAHTHSASTNTAGNHNHTLTSRGHYNGTTTVAAGYTQVQGTVSTSTAGNHSHTVTVNSSGESGVGKNLPPYYKAAFIMKG